MALWYILFINMVELENIYIGFGIKISYIELANILKIDITNLTRLRSLRKIKKYLKKNEIDGLKLTILLESHMYTLEDSDDEPYDRYEKSISVYFGRFISIGQCFHQNNLSRSRRERLTHLFTECNFEEICALRFGIKPQLMTFVGGWFELNLN